LPQFQISNFPLGLLFGEPCIVRGAKASACL